MCVYTFDYGISNYCSDGIRSVGGGTSRYGLSIVTRTNIGFLWASKSPKGNCLLQVALGKK